LLQVPSLNVNATTYSRLTAVDIADKLCHYELVRRLKAVAGQHSDDYVLDSASEDSDDVSIWHASA